MAAISAAKAREHLDVWLEAESAIATGQSYQIGNRSLTRANLADVRRQIDYWRGLVERAEAEEAGAKLRAVRAYRIVPRDL